MRTGPVILVCMTLIFACTEKPDRDSAVALQIKSSLENDLGLRLSGGKTLFDNYVTGGKQRGFVILGLVDGNINTGMQNISDEISGWFEADQWEPSLQYAADGPTGTKFAFMKSNDLAVISIELAESVLKGLSDNEPIDLSSLSAEQMKYNLKIHVIPDMSNADDEPSAPEITFKAYLMPILISNAVAVFLIILCASIPKAGRIAWFIIFLGAGIFNIYSAFRDPQAYLMYEKTAVLPFYKTFISGAFSQNIKFFITLIGAGQLAVAIMLLMRKPLFNLGILGGIVFLLAITPLGIGSAFPCTILMIISLLALRARIES